MRKLFYWYVPAAVALIAAGVFAMGFYSFMRGDTGEAVAAAPAQSPSQQTARRATIVPVILGDSVARGTGDETGLGIGGRLVENLRRRHVESTEAVNLAINGARTFDLREQLGHANVRAVIAGANTVVISIGGNDLWADNMRAAPLRDPAPIMSAVLDRIGGIVSTVRAANPHARIYVVGLYNPFNGMPQGGMLTPLVQRWTGTMIERFASDGNVTVVQTADLFRWRDRLSLDRFHPSGEGYELIARRIADTF